MARDQQRIDAIRGQQSELENHVMDEFFAGRISRREFVRRSTVLGMGLTSIGAFLAACGQTGTTPSPATGVKKGGKMTVAVIAPAGKIDPFLVADEGGLAVLGQAGEYLVWSDKDLQLRPVLATKWSPNSDGSVWTFTIRSGVKFNDGTPMTAKDVAATLNAHADSANKSNALSALSGVLSKGGAVAKDDTTVQFTLDAPNGSFPYLISSDNYNVIILPASYDYSKKYEDTLLGTGPWKKASFTTGKGASYVKNPSYWDSGTPNLDSIDLAFYAEDQPRILSLGTTSDVISQFPVGAGQTLLTNPSVTAIGLRSAAHRQVHMRTDTGPFTDKRVRQAMALIIDRPGLVAGLLKGKAEVGNDSPFAPVFPFTDTSVAQRALDVAKAKQLMADAGKSSGFTTTLYTWNSYEIPDLAQLIKSAAQQIGVTLNLQANLDPDTYYSKYWLDSAIGITDYGHRGVPNVFLTAPLTSKGTWNAPHFANSDYDNLVKQYVAASDLQSQKRLAGQIENLLLDQTPIIFPYFYYHMSATKTTVSGVEPTAMGHINMKAAGFKS